MFDLITGREKHLPSHATLPILVSTTTQVIVVTLILVVPMLYVTDRLPEVPTMMAFVAAAPAPLVRGKLGFEAVPSDLIAAG